MTQAQYLEAAFKAYFPTSDITVDDSDETIHVHVTTSTGKPNHFNLISWVFECGSDDDRYIFVRSIGDDEDLADHGSPEDVITVPLMPKGD